VDGTRTFWSIWLAAFPDKDYEVTRTVAADNVVVTQWVFSGTHTASLDPPVFDPALAATGRTIRFRGVSVYDLDTDSSGLIRRETTYLDLATVMVELGVEL
jgi:predicted ester cyclase